MVVVVFVDFIITRAVRHRVLKVLGRVLFYFYIFFFVSRLSKDFTYDQVTCQMLEGG